MAESTKPCTVYQYFGVGGQLLYVGITERGVRRAHEHADLKHWWELAVGCTLEHFATRDEALAREADLIRRFRPPFNQQHNPERALPLAERSGASVLARPKPQGVTAGTLKERRRAYYAATPEQRAQMPCVHCQERPTHRGPSCLVCQQARPKYTSDQ